MWWEIFGDSDYLINRRNLCPMVVPDSGSWLSGLGQIEFILLIAALLCFVLTWMLYLVHVRLRNETPHGLAQNRGLLITIPTVATLDAVALLVPSAHLPVQIFTFMWSALQLSRCVRRVKHALIRSRRLPSGDAPSSVAFLCLPGIRVDPWNVDALFVLAEQVAIVRSTLLLIDAVLEGEAVPTPLALMAVNAISTVIAMVALSLLRKVDTESSRFLLVIQVLIFTIAMLYSVFEFLGRQAIIPCTPALPELVSSRFIYRLVLMYALGILSGVITACLVLHRRRLHVTVERVDYLHDRTELASKA